MNGWARAWIWLLVCFIGAVWQPVQAQGVVRYYVTDALGSVVVVTDESGNVMERREYEPYGAQLTPAVQDGPGYTGHVQDAATGLVYMQQRYYDPEIGRMLSRDPVTAFSSSDMRYFNGYAYAFNNPYKFTDPDGRCPNCIGAGVGAGLEFLVQAVEIGVGARDSFDVGDIVISGVAGATGVGAARLIGRAERVGTLAKIALNRAADAGVSAGSQLAKDGEVSLKDTAIDVVAGATVGDALGARAASVAERSGAGKLLERQANRAERIAAGNPRAAKQDAAAAARGAQREHVGSAAATSGVNSSNAASSAVKITCTAGNGRDC